VEQAVRVAHAASVAAGAPLSQRAMAERFGMSRRRVSQLIAGITVESKRPCAGREGSMSMNRYDVIARRHWARWRPGQYAEISDPESFFTTAGEEAARVLPDPGLAAGNQHDVPPGSPALGQGCPVWLRGGQRSGHLRRPLGRVVAEPVRTDRRHAVYQPQRV
jgi:hypothetical protein